MNEVSSARDCAVESLPERRSATNAPGTWRRRLLRGVVGPRAAAIAAVAVASLVQGVGGSVAQAADGCPNAAIRAQQHAENLPECRAYEQVSPVDKNGAEVISVNGSTSTRNVVSGVGSSASGDAASYQTTAELANAQTAPLWSLAVATRGGDWSSRSLTTRQFPTRAQMTTTTFGLSPDQRTAFTYSEYALAPGAVEGNGNYYLLDLQSGRYQLVTTFPDPQEEGPNEAEGAFAVGNGGNQVVFGENRALTPDAVDKSLGIINLYEYADGRLRLLSSPGQQAAALTDVRLRVLSRDGSRVFFEQSDGPYMSIGGSAAVPLAVSRRPGDPLGSQGGDLAGASEDGSVVYFTSAAALTPESTAAPNSRGQLYRLDVERDELVDVTPASAPEDLAGADVGGWASNRSTAIPVSADGSYAYYSARGKLTPDATSDGVNLYGFHDGQTRLIATLPLGYADPTDEWSLSPDGTKLAFLAYSRLSAFDNQTTGDRCPVADFPGFCAEVYLYDWTRDELVCASCPRTSTGAARGPASLGGVRDFGKDGTAYVHPASVRDDGTVFFNSPEPLVREDVNDLQDVYAFRAGQVSLIGSGTSSFPTYFHGMSADGSSIFLTTRGRLVAQDRDDLTDLYSARSDGGIARQQVHEGTLACSGDACQGTAARHVAPPPAATVAFTGAGNVRAASVGATHRVSAPKAATVRGVTTSVKVRVPAAGTIGLTGAGLARAGHKARKAGTYRLAATLTTRARASLRKRGTLRIAARVTFAPQRGGRSSTVVRLTFRRPAKAATTRARASRRAGHAAGSR